MTDKEIAIKVENISKTFRIPHEKVTTLKGAFVSTLKSRGYEEFKALDGVSFEVKKGEFFGIIGRNGSGKSTLLKILAGIYKPDKKGKVHINGRISPFLELGIGFNPELSGRDNIYLNAAVLGLTKKQIDEKFDDIVEFSELRRFIDQKVKNYSSGMQVRLAFSVAIHANRDILLMDEVLAVGDSNFQQKCLAEFRKLKKEGKTIIFVSHELESVRKFCDKVLLLDASKKIIVAGAERAIFEYSRIMMEDGKTRSAIVGEKKAARKVEKKENKFLSLELARKEGERTKVFEGGESIRIKMKLDVGKVEDDMFVSVGIFDRESNVLVCGNSMYYEKVYKNWKLGQNQVELVFDNNLFNRGDFYAVAYFFRGDPLDRYFYDIYNGSECGEYFKVIPTNGHFGLTHLPHEWK